MASPSNPGEGVGREERTVFFVLHVNEGFINYFSLKLEIETLEISLQCVSQCF